MGTHDRHISFDGVFNFRDVGGYAADGNRSVAWRRVFRSGALEQMTGCDVALATEELGLSTVLDLRHPEELASVEHQLGPLFEADVQRHHLSLHPADMQLGEYRKSMDKELGQGLSGRRYFAWLRFAGLQLATAFELLAEKSTYPVVIHCTAGKDRTGITIGLLLNLIGVADEQVVADYELSNLSTGPLIEYLESVGRLPDLPADELQKRVATPAERMEEFLALLREQYGGARGYLREQGLSDQTLDRVADHLFE